MRYSNKLAIISLAVLLLIPFAGSAEDTKSTSVTTPEEVKGTQATQKHKAIQKAVIQRKLKKTKKQKVREGDQKEKIVEKKQKLQRGQLQAPEKVRPPLKPKALKAPEVQALNLDKQDPVPQGSILKEVIIENKQIKISWDTPKYPQFWMIKTIDLNDDGKIDRVEFQSRDKKAFYLDKLQLTPEQLQKFQELHQSGISQKNTLLSTIHNYLQAHPPKYPPSICTPKRKKAVIHLNPDDTSKIMAQILYHDRNCKIMDKVYIMKRYKDVDIPLRITIPACSNISRKHCELLEKLDQIWR